MVANNARFLILPGPDCPNLAMATLADIVRGQRDLAAFASKLTPFQLRTLGSYRNRSGSYD